MWAALAASLVTQFLRWFQNSPIGMSAAPSALSGSTRAWPPWPPSASKLQTALVEQFAGSGRNGSSTMQVADRFLIVVPEAVAQFLVATVQPASTGSQGVGIVAVARDEFLDEIRRPVGGGPDFVAVEHQDLHRAEAVTPFRHLVEQVVDVGVGGLAAQVVDDEAAGIRARAVEELAGVVANETQDAP